MTPLQRRFVDEYLVDLNATQAAIRAGYAKTGANGQGYHLRRKPEVAAAIRQAMAERQERTRITADRVLREYARIAFADIRRLTGWGPDGILLRPHTEVSEDDAAAIAELVVGSAKQGGGARLKLHDKKSALDMLARHLGLLGRPGPDGAAALVDPARELELEEGARERLARRLARLEERDGED
jgi:phage terminase small subunit